MGMADPLSRPSRMEATISFEKTNDDLLTCIFCGREEVDYESTYNNHRGQRISFGAHYECIGHVCS